jgi:putative redox protein
LFLQVIAGCTGQIVVMYLKKMKAEMPSKFSIDITGKLTSEHTMYFENIAITYKVKGSTDKNKLKKVIKMSEEQYCGLTFMVSKLEKIETKLFLNGENTEI